MPLCAGTRLGPYEILTMLGAGGMGEVYRARDPRMGREVAIKLSAERFSDRFEREVRAVAALNHTNICQVYDVGPSYLVLELVEGPTLAERIKTGALPLEEALTIARQIADALEAAHERGIIHRDLKPANIKIKPDGAVKVLDFGLAKIAEQTAAAASPEESPTVAMGATVVGQVMGTAAYMAPEQARGKSVDKRADIWAFGVVLYEMLTGRRLFPGETISDTLAGVLAKEPDWGSVPANLRRLLQRCLEKEPKRRLRDIGDAWHLLEDAPTPAAAKARLPWAIVGALAIGLALSFWAPWRSIVRPTEQSSTRLDFDLGSEISLAFGVGPSVILSPDGTRLVFVSKTQEGTSLLFTRRLDQPKSVPLQMTEGAYSPFFSPDGQWVGFFAQGKLRKIRIDGSELVSLCDAPNGRGASWIEDGSIVASLDTQAGLSQVQPEGGKAVPLTKLNLEAGETSHRWPQVLPGGKDVLFMASNTYGHYDDAKIAVVSLRDHHTKTLFEHAGTYPHYLPSGHLTYVTKQSLFAVPFDLDRLEVRGAATFIEGVSTGWNFGSAQIDFTRQGTYLTGRSDNQASLQWLDANGKLVSAGFDPGTFLFAGLSPDGRRAIIVDNQISGSDLWVYDLERHIKSNLTSGIAPAFPAWSPDGRFVVFHAPGGLFSLLADGTGKPQRLTQDRVQIPATFTPDGAHLLYSELTPAGGAEFRIASVESGPRELKLGDSQLFLSSLTQNTFAAFSPNGKWLAYASAETGHYEVHVTSFPDKRIHVPVSNAGGIMPVWSPNNRELFYRTLDHRIMVVNYKAAGDSFVAGVPRLWSGRQLSDTGIGTTYGLAPDGKRFLVLMPVEGTETRERQSHVMLVFNFFDEVRRLVAGHHR